ncbi:MAG: OmpW family outer membrane protein [Pseudomonadota bacterium]
MKRIGLVLCCALVMALAFSQAGLAQEHQGKFGIGIRGAYYDFDDSPIMASSSSSEIKSSVLYGINLTFFSDESFSIELASEYTKSDLKIGGAKAGDFTQIPVLLTGRLHLPIGKMFSPYVGGGIGYYFNDFSKTRSSSPLISVDNRYGFHAVLGTEIFVHTNWAINLDARYVWTEADTKTVTGIGGINLDAYTVGGGIKYFF